MTISHQWTRRSPLLPQCRPPYHRRTPLPQNYASQTNPAAAAAPTPPPPSLQQAISILMTAVPLPLRPQLQQLLRFMDKSA